MNHVNAHLIALLTWVALMQLHILPYKTLACTACILQLTELAGRSFVGAVMPACSRAHSTYLP